jgi:hypothetical protein
LITTNARFAHGRFFQHLRIPPNDSMAPLPRFVHPWTDTFSRGYLGFAGAIDDRVVTKPRTSGSHDRKAIGVTRGIQRWGERRYPTSTTRLVSDGGNDEDVSGPRGGDIKQSLAFSLFTFRFDLLVVEKLPGCVPGETNGK